MRAYGGNAFRAARWHALAAVCLGLLSLGAVGTCAAYYVADALPRRDLEGAPNRSSSLRVPPRHATNQPEMPRIKVADADDPWLQSLRSGSYFTRQSGNKSEQRSTRDPSSAHKSGPARHAKESGGSTARAGARHLKTSAVQSIPIPAEWRALAHSRGATFRTVCVRLCDGYYWPISSAAPKDALDRDSKICEQSCSRPALLYFYPDLNGQPENMVNLKGEPYARLSKAFAYRTTYDPSCKCKPHPWEPEAIANHAQHAREAQGEVAEPERH